MFLISFPLRSTSIYSQPNWIGFGFRLSYAIFLGTTLLSKYFCPILESLTYTLSLFCFKCCWNVIDFSKDLKYIFSFLGDFVIEVSPPSIEEFCFPVLCVTSLTFACRGLLTSLPIGGSLSNIDLFSGLVMEFLFLLSAIYGLWVIMVTF